MSRASKFYYALVGLLVIVGLAGLFHHAVWGSLDWTIHDPDGYNLFSGDIGDIEGAGVFIAVGIGLWRQAKHIREWREHHECHVQGCHHLQWKTVPGTDWVLCKHHHPHDEPTHEQVLAQHAAHATSTSQ